LGAGSIVEGEQGKPGGRHAAREGSKTLLVERNGFLGGDRRGKPARAAAYHNNVV
jgi:hypothetical protein